MNGDVTSSPHRPVAWTIASSDCSGGAGIQADLITMNRLGVYGCSILTGITIQNTRSFTHLEPVPLNIIAGQLDALESDIKPAAIKTGMFGSAESLDLIATRLKHFDVPVVCDPVVKATLSVNMVDAKARQDLLHRLLPITYMVTPNIDEAEVLTGIAIHSPADILRAANYLIERGVKTVLIKGGHQQGEFSSDYWTDGIQSAWLTSPRKSAQNTHGTGCTLSAAITALLALGYSGLDAAIIAKAYVNQGLRLADHQGNGRGPLFHGGWPDHADDMPSLLKVNGEFPVTRSYPPLDIPTPDVYPVVDRAEWIKRLAPHGVQLIQLRAKDLSGEALDAEVKTAVEYGRAFNVRVIINDAWQSALKLGAYGVHLGQDDLDGVDFTAIQKAGLRLGISTHNAAEIARAIAYQPSYIAIGTLYPSPSKSFTHQALGLEKFKRLSNLCHKPVVAIGGITLETSPAVLQAGVDIIAVISDITRAVDPEQRMQAWHDALSKLR